MNTSSIKNPFMIVISIILLIVVCFLILQPTLRQFILPRYRSFLVAEFIKNCEKHKTIDPQYFWMTREFASAGAFVYKHDGLSQKQLKLIESKTDSKIHITLKTLPFLMYESANWNSLESLVHAPDIASVVKEPIKGNKRIVFRNDHELIYYENPHVLKIVFIKSIGEMKTANGFFDFAGHDKNLIDGRFWLSISTVVI